MATEKQIAANRANAKRSTGPKTLAGKLKSSRNAYRHGLSAPLRLDPLVSTKVVAIAHVLAGNEDRLTSGADFARAQLEVLRIRSRRTELMAKIQLNDISMQELRRVAALDRYERYSLTRRRRALLKLMLHPVGEGVTG
jgi:hypothetical protein